MKIPYITLWVKEFDAQVRFYKEILGLKPEQESTNFIQFATGRTGLYMHRIKEDSPGLRDKVLEIHFEVEDVDQRVAELEAKGVLIEDRPVNMPWGSRIASFRDPEGFVVELVGPHKEGEPVEEHPMD